MRIALQRNVDYVKRIKERGDVYFTRIVECRG